MKLRAALLLVSILMAGKSYAAPMFVVPSQDPFIVGSFAFGEIFTVGPSDILVSSLGAYDAFGEGFNTLGGIPVGIFRELDDELVASTFVLSDDLLIDGFRYHTLIDPLVLLSGADYRVVAVNGEASLALRRRSRGRPCRAALPQITVRLKSDPTNNHRQHHNATNTNQKPRTTNRTTNHQPRTTNHERTKPHEPNP